MRRGNEESATSEEEKRSHVMGRRKRGEGRKKEPTCQRTRKGAMT